MVSLKNTPGELDIFIRDDKMAAYIKTITPPTGDGAPLTVEDVTRTLADMGIVFGIDMEAVEKAVSEVNTTGVSSDNILIASGDPGNAGKDAILQIKIGNEAANTDEHSKNMVRPDQVVANRIPSEAGDPGHNVLGYELPPNQGKNIKIIAGENVRLSNGNTAFVSEIYGMAKTTWKDVSVSNLVKISEDKMSAEIPIVPVLADNSKLSLNDILSTLKKSGVTSGIDKAIISKNIYNEKYVPSLKVAEGIPAIDGIDAKIEYRFKLNNQDPETIDKLRRNKKMDLESVLKESVVKGDILAVKTPLKEPVDGRTVTGDIIKGKRAADKKIKAGKNIVLLDDGITYAVAGVVIGYADISGDTIFVEDPVTVSEDSMQAFLTVQPVSGSGSKLTLESVNELLNDRGIIYGIDKEAIERSLKQVEVEGKPLNKVIIANGKPAERGDNARIEFKIDLGKSAGTLKGDDGRIDYHERGSIHNVKKGDVIAVKIPLTPGKKGTDIFGRVLESEKGTDVKLVTGNNVAVSDDGLIFTSFIDGMVAMLNKGRIGVFDVYEVSGDVDYSTGNLNMEGSLDIRGWVKSGFHVRARGEIRIGGGIEDAYVESGGGLYVKGGIIGTKKGIILSGGDLTANFIENAHVHADGDIFVLDNIVRSTVSSSGNINVEEGKGRIVGGSVEAVKGIQANEIGLETGIKTRVGVGTDLKMKNRMEDVTRRQADYKRSRAKMDMVLARYLKNGKTGSLPKETVIKLTKLAKLRRQSVMAEKRLSIYMKELERELITAGAYPAEVKVNKVVYAGTSIIIQKHLFSVEEDIKERVIFRFNENQGAVEVVH